MTRRILLVLCVALASTLLAPAAGAAEGLAARKADPYLGAIVEDAATGDVLFEYNADAQAYPASVLKLMNLLILLEKIEGGALKLEEPVTTTAEASTIGGSQVYLKEHEVFPVEDLLYALMVQSANDAAAALAIHVAGTKDGFVELMNERAKALGMTATTFHSVHGLPPGAGQEPDVTTARDFAILCRELLKHPDALKYTSTKERAFRETAPEPFIMRNHNPLLSSFEGCDGFKTGYISKGGYSMAVTAERKGERVVVVILGCEDRKVRNAKAAELLAKGFLEIAKKKEEQKKAAAAPTPAPATQ